MPIKQSYAEHGDACATAHAMELLGDKWTYPILRELMLGPKRFTEIAASVRGITPAVLTARLRELENNSLVRRSRLPQPAGAGVYDVTEWARALTPIFESLGRWAQVSPTRVTAGCGLTPDAAVQSMLTMAPQSRFTPPLDLTLQLHDGRVGNGPGYRYQLHWTEHLEISRGQDARATTASVRADSSVWAGILYEGVSLDSAEITGSRRDVERLVAVMFDEATRFGELAQGTTDELLGVSQVGVAAPPQ